MVKIQTIEKLFKFLLESSYLILPFLFLISKGKRFVFIQLICIYGLVYFFFLHYWDSIPKDLKKIQQTVYTLLEYSFFAYIFYKSIENRSLRIVVLVFSFAFFLFQVFTYAFLRFQKIDSISIGIETLILFVFATLYFQQFLKNNLTNNIYEYASFWLVVGVLVYLGCSFFFNILANHITEQQFKDYWHYTFIPEIIKNILFAVVVVASPNKLILETKQSPPIRKDIPNLDMI